MERNVLHSSRTMKAWRGKRSRFTERPLEARGLMNVSANPSMHKCHGCEARPEAVHKKGEHGKRSLDGNYLL